MALRQTFEHLLFEKNPFAKARRNRLRKKLTNRTPSFLCPNCIGGILFHDLGLQFRSPTVNLMMLQTHFVKFVRNLDEYLAAEFAPFLSSEFSCPCAHLKDIDVHFTHYSTFEDGVKKWKERTERIDPNNLFIFLSERDGLTYEDIKSLGKLRVRGIVVFTAQHYPDIPYALHISKYAPDGEVGNILKRSYWDGHREYETYFDFVKWFNEANGGDYDIRPYVK